MGGRAAAGCGTGGAGTPDGTGAGSDAGGSNTIVIISGAGWSGVGIRRAIMTSANTIHTCTAIDPSSDQVTRDERFATPPVSSRGPAGPSGA